ncbi:hypothetical protein [Sulfuriroseicoccus oceanibius]|uniref:Uncharacterized protein n=1 Tax=Sulfuriroseicoccus oceanibius TaxID=2707525 RepID=A0A6B3L527_9BACT|nr:hypothetical protein [Sulfuriroseicoccus oceanibius]QQL44762.1 hypothetical protein G3M56_012910 [Sulfuriroseicoccus oceanibius]
MKSPLPLIALAAALAIPTASATTPATLTQENYDSVKAHVAPTDRDFAFTSVDWKSSLPDAINAASSQDKPILLWLYFGNPTGNC